MHRLLAVLAVVLALTGGAAFGSGSATLLRLDGIGPLRLGMTRQAALATGWLAHRSPGCELAGPPRPVAYMLTGPKAPAGVSGTAEFMKGTLRNLSFSRGVRTAAGIEVGRSSVPQMVTRYRAAGYKATSRYSPTFQGTFVTVGRGGKLRIGGFAEHGTIELLAIPAVSVCD